MAGPFGVGVEGASGVGVNVCESYLCLVLCNILSDVIYHLGLDYVLFSY